MMIYPSRFFSPILVLIFSTLMACSGSPAPGESAQAQAVQAAATIPVFLDGEPATMLSSPNPEGAWPLLSVMPAGLPPTSAWLELTLKGEKSTHIVKHPAEADKRAVWYLESNNGVLRLSQYDFIQSLSSKTSKRFERPTRVLLEPTRINVKTVEIEAQEPVWARLRVTVAGEAKGRMRIELMEDTPQTKDLDRPAKAGGWPLRFVVSRYTDDFLAVELVTGGTVIRLSRTEVMGGDTILLRPTKKGWWVMKRWRTGGGEGTRENVREIGALNILR